MQLPLKPSQPTLLCTRGSGEPMARPCRAAAQSCTAQQTPQAPNSSAGTGPVLSHSSQQPEEPGWPTSQLGLQYTTLATHRLHSLQCLWYLSVSISLESCFLPSAGRGSKKIQNTEHTMKCNTLREKHKAVYSPLQTLWKGKLNELKCNFQILLDIIHKVLKWIKDFLTTLSDLIQHLYEKVAYWMDSDLNKTLRNYDALWWVFQPWLWQLHGTNSKIIFRQTIPSNYSAEGCFYQVSNIRSRKNILW